jgi:hypothetical protein
MEVAPGTATQRHQGGLAPWRRACRDIDPTAAVGALTPPLQKGEALG